ncbi:MAG TPA: hypothetical protein VK663_12500, partial [Burkholderiales bacterium]|nr:hypothetical protein [Burkholderiales bacterium]
MLSPTYTEIKRLRGCGRIDAALTMLKTHRPASDADAFEGVVSLFVAGDLDSVVHVCRTHHWQDTWATHMCEALTEMLVNNNAPRALAVARTATQDPTITLDALAFYLSMLQANGLTDEAYAYICNRLDPPPLGETFLLTVMAEIAAAAKQWLRAYQLACAVMAMDTTNYRALIVLSTANFNSNNFHEALGNAQCADLINPGSVPAALQIMRCQNKLSDFYSVVAAFDALDRNAAISPEMHIELGTAYAGLENTDRAAGAYRAALNADPPPVEALRALLKIYVDSADRNALTAFVRQFDKHIENDAECIRLQGLEQLRQGNLGPAAALFRKCNDLNIRRNDAYAHLPWPVPEPRIRHDYEQLDLLRRRGKLNAAGHDALRVLQPYYGQSGNTARTFAPEGAAAAALKQALCEIHHYPDPAFDGEALTGNDYPAIEAQYDAEKIVVIDNFLTPAALAELRRYSEEATVWKMYNTGGYTAALLVKGFAPRVLLAIADGLRRMMPQVINDYPLLQAWGFKYDQRMQG